MHAPLSQPARAHLAHTQPQSCERSPAQEVRAVQLQPRERQTRRITPPNILFNPPPLVGGARDTPTRTHAAPAHRLGWKKIITATILEKNKPFFNRHQGFQNEGRRVNVTADSEF